eukprot:4147654-Alexandrium_andersonii.AAC.1
MASPGRFHGYGGVQAGAFGSQLSESRAAMGFLFSAWFELSRQPEWYLGRWLHGESALSGGLRRARCCRCKSLSWRGPLLFGFLARQIQRWWCAVVSVYAIDHASRSSDRQAAGWWYWCVCRWGAAIAPMAASWFRL